jgi:hypothetical protein
MTAHNPNFTFAERLRGSEGLRVDAGAFPACVTGTSTFATSAIFQSSPALPMPEKKQHGNGGGYG